MPKIRFALIFFVLFAFAQSQASEIKEFRLENGLKVLVIEDHKAPLATFQIWYRTGSINEPLGKTGMSHLLEHMMFKGTPRYGSKVFSNIIQRNGGTDNAFTTKDYTMYFQTLSSDRISLAIELEADRMTNLLLDPKELKAERNVVMEERRMRYEDDPQNLLDEEITAASFKVHQYRWPVIGWMSNIASIEREDLYGYYRTYYAPDNAFIIVSGDVDPEKIISTIKKEFGSIPRAAGKRQEIKNDEPDQVAEKRIFLKKEAEVPYIVMAYHVPSFPHEDSFALDVLSSILSGGKSSRLYKSLTYEKKLALNSFADYSGFHKAPFLFNVGAVAVPDKDIEDIEKALDEEMERIKKEPPSESEMQKARNQVEAFFVFAQDSNYSKAFYTGMFEVLGDWKLKDKYLAGIRKVKPADVQAVAKKYFTDTNKTAGILIPVRKEK